MLNTIKSDDKLDTNPTDNPQLGEILQSLKSIVPEEMSTFPGNICGRDFFQKYTLPIGVTEHQLFAYPLIDESKREFKHNDIDILYTHLCELNPELHSIPVRTTIDKCDVIRGVASRFCIEDIYYFVTVLKKGRVSESSDNELFIQALSNIGFVPEKYKTFISDKMIESFVGAFVKQDWTHSYAEGRNFVSIAGSSVPNGPDYNIIRSWIKEHGLTHDSIRNLLLSYPSIVYFFIERSVGATYRTSSDAWLIFIPEKVVWLYNQIPH